MLPIVLSFVVCLAVSYFSTLSHNCHEFREGGGDLLNSKRCASIFSTTLFGKFFSLRRIQIYYHKSIKIFIKLIVIIVRFEWHLNFLGRLSKYTKKLNENPSVSMQTDRWTDRQI